MTRLFSKSVLVLAGFLFFGVYPSFQANVSPKVDFVEDNKSDHVPPKIQGVRVIVDATKMNGGKMEDKTETIRIQTDGAKQTVGIHTDITFELDDKKNDTKKTDGKNAESDEDDDDTEVPVYRGTHTEGERNNFNRRYDPNYYMNQPNYHGPNDEDSYKYADTGAGTWVRFLPMLNGGGWTTERYSESFVPQNRRFQSGGFPPSSGFVPYGIGQKSCRPCICDDRQSSHWRDSNRRLYRPSSPRPQGTDDKLEIPFSETD